jgi:phosphoglycolate phosphatase
MVGDRLYDVNGAKGAGILSVGVLYGYGSKAELEEAGADFLAQDVTELNKILLNI